MPRKKQGCRKRILSPGLSDKKITSPEDLMDAVRSYKPNDNIKIDYLRNDKKKDIKVKLGETKEKRRSFIYKNDGQSWNSDGFNFKMPKMPKMPDMPKVYNYNYSFGNRNAPQDWA